MVCLETLILVMGSKLQLLQTMTKPTPRNLRWKVAQAAEIRWWRQYLRPKPPAQYLADKGAYWKRVMAQADIRCPAGSQVLDAGCGPAGIFMVLDHCAVTAIDPLLPAYRKLPHFEEKAYPHVQFRAQPLEALRACAEYDLIFCLNVINHVADIRLSLERLQLALRPGGRCWLSVDAHRHHWLQPIFRALPGDILHPHQYTLLQYKELLAQTGFRVERELLLKPGGIFDYYLLELHLAFTL
jgi:2-polyprenyl-6-hydroxyphenyl methylase/3-demethylubiquinone-9 3-methyltransferase